MLMPMKLGSAGRENRQHAMNTGGDRSCKKGNARIFRGSWCLDGFLEHLRTNPLEMNQYADDARKDYSQGTWVQMRDERIGAVLATRTTEDTCVVVLGQSGEKRPFIKNLANCTHWIEEI